jgi:hypothetical protein
VVDDINMVINYDYPAGASAEFDFMNRLRNLKVETKNSIAITFFPADDKDNAQSLANLLKELKQVRTKSQTKIDC